MLKIVRVQVPLSPTKSPSTPFPNSLLPFNFERVSKFVIFLISSLYFPFSQKKYPIDPFFPLITGLAVYMTHVQRGWPRNPHVIC